MNKPFPLIEHLPVLLLRITVWVLLFLTLYFLRAFSLLIFLTFVFSYTQHSCARKLEKYISHRKVRVSCVFTFLLLILIGIGAFIVPPVRQQTTLFVSRFPGYIESLDRSILLLAEEHPLLSEYLPEKNSFLTLFHEEPFSVEKSVTVVVAQKLLGTSMTGEGGLLAEVALTARDLGGRLLAVGSAFFLSLLFSLLILFDLPNLTASTKRLQESKVGFIYEEVADTFSNFARVLGQALEAQLGIAMLNTILTAIGILCLGQADKIAFLSVIVFICSFVPVVGVFLSSIPICLIEMQDAGLTGLFLAIGLITIIHFIEAYILNPRIYGQHMHVNPVLVLIILTVGGKMFGVWGLVLGVPLCRYVFGHAIWPKATTHEL